MDSKKFWWGALAGVLASWAFHAFIRPLPRKDG